MSMATVISLIGGLGLFLYGMKLMSEALEKAAGAKMRSILEFFTKNKLMGTFVGIVFTAIVQSSSATTVMVVSFVNSGLMTLAQAAGVIMGANIGTTVTSQLIAFDLSKIAPLFVMIGVVMMMISKKVKVKRFGEVVLGFGILFVGLSTMSGAMSGFRNSPVIVDMLSSLDNHLLAIVIGFAITAILQSSSATVGIVLLMATQGLLHLDICFFLILGCNVGSCVSALLASLGGKKEAKRAAWIHFMFNVVGSAIIFAILSFTLEPVTNALFEISGGDMGRAVANAHTSIKVLEVIMLFPFIDKIVSLTYKIVPGKDKKSGEEYELQFIGGEKIISPSAAVIDTIHEIENMGKIAITNLQNAMDALLDGDEEKIRIVEEQEKYINYLNHEITNYLIRVNHLELPIADADMIGALFHVVNDVERIGDHAQNMAESAERRIKNNVAFTEKARNNMRELLERDILLLKYSLEMFAHKDQKHMKEILELEDTIDKLERKYQNAHIKRLTKNKCTPEAGMIFTDTISGLERIGDHATNIAFAIMEPSGGEVDLDDMDEDK